MHKCDLKNELNQEISIVNSLWVYDSMDDLFGDFQIKFCPICGIDLKDEKCLKISECVE